MASARNLCQHSDIDGTQCVSNDYILCPHCQLQLCLKHLNYHQELLRIDLYQICNNINLVRYNLDQLKFDSTNHRDELFKQLDVWYNERINLINKIYYEKKQQLNILCIQAQMEFDTYKTKKDKQLKDNLIKQFKKVLKKKQIHIEDLDEMKGKLNDIECGLNELKQLLIDIHSDQTSMDIQIIKRRYIEAAKPLFNDDDDDDNLWDTDDEDETDEKSKLSDDTQNIEEALSSTQHPSSPPEIILLSSLVSTSSSTTLSLPTCSTSSTTIMRKPPLKFIIKRLQPPTASSKVKYKLHTIATSSSSLIT